MDQLQVRRFELGKDIQKIFTNFKKDSASRKTKSYAEARLEALSQAWSKFEAHHEELLTYPNVDTLEYMRKDFHSQVEVIYEQCREVLEACIHDAIERNKASEKLEVQGAILNRQKGIINLFEDLIAKVEIELKNNVSRAFCRQKIDLIKDYWEKIFSLHSEILAMGTVSDDYFHENVFSKTEDKYQAIMLALNLNGSSTSLKSEDEKPRGVKLPTIDIPIFEGSYLRWPSFKDLFVELILKNVNVTEAEKLFYLKSKLNGEPSELVRHLSVTNENFKTAWGILEKRYDNKRILVSVQLKNLLSQQELSRESAEGLKKLHDMTTESLQALGNLGVDTATWGPILVFLLTNKLDRETHRCYEQSLRRPREIPSLKEFLEFLENRFQGLEACDNSKKQSNSKTEGNKIVKAYAGTTEKLSCSICQGNHRTYFCERLTKVSANKRSEVVRKANLCFNCLQRGHMSQSCPSSRRSKTCMRKHNTLLHNHNSPIAMNGNKQITTHLAEQGNSSTILLPTAIVRVLGRNRSLVELRALNDQGSQSSFITEDMVQTLGLKKVRTHATVTGVGQIKVGNVNAQVDLTILPRFASSFAVDTTALVLTNLTKVSPSERVEAVAWSHTTDLVLADPSYHIPGKIDVILGAEVLSKILLDNLLRGPQGSPVAQQTELGWILTGKVSTEKQNNRIQCFVSDTDISKELQKFWSLEEVKSETPLTREEMACEKYFRETVQRDSDGRYTVRMPFKQDPGSCENLSGSRELAIARLLQVENRFKRDKRYETLYKNCINEYIDRGYLVYADKPVDKCYYIPHHGVLKESSTTTKLRVVLDASAKRSGQVSLNDTMMVGPTIQQKLTQILLRWRKHKIAFTADIEQMYLRINLDIRDQDWFRILFRNSSEEPIRELKWTAVIFGGATSPFLATRTIHQLALDEQSSYKNAAEVLIEDTYMDDVVSGADSEEEARELSQDLIQLLKAGGFNLRKWSTNNHTVLTGIPWSLREVQEELDLDHDKEIKALGAYWNTSKDIFRYRVRVSTTEQIQTKREVLSEAAKIFDPIGLLSPVIIRIKMLMQSIWEHGENWDVPLSDELHKRWMEIRNELHLLNNEIPRWVGYHNSCKCELHGFSDASERAYGAAIYVRTITNGLINTQLLVAKTRAAPLRNSQSLPRLELCGATLLANLLNETIKTVAIDNIDYYAWTDSAIVLNWINEHPRKWKTFVANRVAEIQSLTDVRKWYHVKSEDNPADLASRGVRPAVIKSQKLWWEGPVWLRNEGISLTLPPFFHPKMS